MTTPPLSPPPYQVLFLCTGNSARSIMAEAILTHAGKGQFVGFSAGSHPTGAVHPLALETLASMGLPTAGLRSKSWNEFGRPGATPFHFVFTVCDRAAAETCPVWPGQPMTAHWGVEDPAAVEGTPERRRLAFERAAQVLSRRIHLFLSLPLASIDSMTIQHQLREIGRTP